MPTLYRTVVRPIVTEKTSNAYQDRGEYTFVVDPAANKIEIKAAVERLWNVKVKSVQTMNCRGKSRRIGGTVGKRANWKKAIVTLREGHSIEIFEA